MGLRRHKANLTDQKIATYIKNGAQPWSEGYEEYKYRYIRSQITDTKQLKNFKHKKLPSHYGIGIDERCVEYPWLFSKLSKQTGRLLDAGSTFNFDFVVDQPIIKKKDLTIYTYSPESTNFSDRGVSYVYGDLRNMYFRDRTFDEVVSQSTIEHIDMDNSIYGYKTKHSNGKRSYEYLIAVSEMIRVLKPGGRLLLTFPYGKYEYHGFFQQFDSQMLERLLARFKNKGRYTVDYFKYQKDGWMFANKDDLTEVMSYNPHTGKGKFDDGAAHCRSVACIEFIKQL